MKRSEAVEIIAKVIRTIRSNDTKAESTNSDILHEEEYARFILYKIEEAGMLPPFAHLKNLGTLDTAWEPEE